MKPLLNVKEPIETRLKLRESGFAPGRLLRCPDHAAFPLACTAVHHWLAVCATAPVETLLRRVELGEREATEALAQVRFCRYRFSPTDELKYRGARRVR